MAANKFHKIAPLEQEQHILIDYEEVILASGLPMNELWLRIEKLRQNFYFLPCPEDRQCTDQQRIVYNEDIIQFVYPLPGQVVTLNLMIIILRLLKIPLPSTAIRSHFHTRSDDASTNMVDFDAIEELLALYVQPSIDVVGSCNDRFDALLFELIKEFSVGPTYLPTHLGHDLYLNVLLEFLMLFSECGGEVLGRRQIFLQLWLQLERVLLRIDRWLGKTAPDKLKRLRAKVKNLLKRDENRNALQLYTEYALIELEMGDAGRAENVLQTALSQVRRSDDDYARSEYFAAYIVYAELALRTCNVELAISVLCNLLVGDDGETATTETRKLLALHKGDELAKSLIAIEKNVTIFELEQCFGAAEYVLSVMKANVYLLMLVRGKEPAIGKIEVWLRIFAERSNRRHTFLRESLYELLVMVVSVGGGVCGGGGGGFSGAGSIVISALLYDVLCRGMDEFPDNFVLCRAAATLEGQVSGIF